ncbi:MAG: cysteine hydrolase [Rhodobacteraceae bacterium]|nr:MAG: cysteine hydrolase [Paracoccaceae bacterium]
MTPRIGPGRVVLFRHRDVDFLADDSLTRLWQEKPRPQQPPSPLFAERIRMSSARTDFWTLTQQGLADLSRRRKPARRIEISAAPDPVLVDLARSALIIVDMQNDFIDDAGWFAAMRGVSCAPLRAVGPRINALSRALRAQGAGIIHLNTGVRADLANLPAGAIARADDLGRRAGFGFARAEALGPVMVAGHWGAQSHPEIERAESDITVLKTRYSGFRDNELDQILRRLDVTTLFFAGVNLDRCVFATLIDGAFQGFDPILVTDACATPSPPATCTAILELVEMLYGFTTTTENILTGRTPPHPQNGD